MKLIELSQGKFSKIDDEDLEKVSAFKWCFNLKGKNSTGYAQRSQHVRLGKLKYTTKTIYLHQFVLGLEGVEIDHINGDTLDNRKENLRPASHRLNMRNRKSVPGSTSIFVGVHFHKLTKKWRAQINVDGKRKSLGLFYTQEAAAEARAAYIESKNLNGFRR